MEETLGKIKAFADRSHGEQMRRYTGERYIRHPERVMKICREYTDLLPVLAAALLHDVLEDTMVNEDDLLQYLQEVMKQEDARETLAIVVELTDVFTKKNYPRLNRRKRRAREAERLSAVSFEAQTVKYADTLDNAIDIAEHDPLDFAPVFLRECQGLLKKMHKGNPELYARTVKTVNECVETVKKKNKEIHRQR